MQCDSASCVRRRSSPRRLVRRVGFRYWAFTALIILVAVTGAWLFDEYAEERKDPTRKKAWARTKHALDVVV